MKTSIESPQRWARASPIRTRPDRAAGGFYRTAEGKDRAFGGVPLNSVDAAVVSAVQLAYKVAEAQIDRSTRLAKRLREAGDRVAGPHSERQAVDALERLVMNAIMSGLAWWETSVADGRCPIKRLAGAEYRMLGSMLGFAEPAQGRRGRSRAPKAAEDIPEERRAPFGTSDKAAPAGLRIVNKVEARQRRPVTVETWTMDPMRALDDSVYFFSVDPAAETEPLQARLVVAEGGREAQLELDKSWGGVRGTWKAAVFDADGVQSGLIQISL